MNTKSSEPKLYYVTYPPRSRQAPYFSTVLAHSDAEARRKVFEVTGGKHLHLTAKEHWTGPGTLREIPLQPARSFIPAYYKGLT